MIENPVPLLTAPAGTASTPVFLPQSALGYPRVFEKCLDVVGDYFEIDPAGTNRYAGIIRTKSRIAPGIEQPWKMGSPSLYQRLLAFKQTIRHRAVLEITTGRDGGYFVDVKVLNELEDLAQPTRATAGQATFRLESTVERQFDVVEPGQFDASWIPIGRDLALEQVILERISRLDCEGK
ncbi:MAG: hypothetical protein EBV06_00085 [Planctomycetia bacterium]|nr:hypothetical protein [Planctomycetia bacterium]